jgi:alkylhydroperoxidase family enzyme
MTRISPVEPPFEPEAGRLLERMMPPGVPPIGLFRTFARNLPMTEAMTGWGRYELSKALQLTMRDREIVIDRTCAQCGCEYEWGVHVAFFAERVALTREQIVSLTHGGPDDRCWTDDRDRLLVRTVDALHRNATVDDDLWAALRHELDEAAILDLLLLCGWYHAISFAANGAHVSLEEGAPRFADYASPTATPVVVP